MAESLSSRDQISENISSLVEELRSIKEYLNEQAIREHLLAAAHSDSDRAINLTHASASLTNSFSFLLELLYEEEKFSENMSKIARISLGLAGALEGFEEILLPVFPKAKLLRSKEIFIELHNYCTINEK